MRRQTSISYGLGRRQKVSGYSLAELLISLLFLSLIIIGTLTLIDTSNRLAVGQINRSDMQQSARVAQRDIIRRIRMLGRGGLPSMMPPGSAAVPAGMVLPQGLAVSIMNNAQSQSIGTNAIVEDTDALRVRGVFSTPVYLVNYTDSNSFSFDQVAGTGTVILRSVTPIGNVDQDVEPLLDLVSPDPDDPTPVAEALLLSSPFDDRIWAVVELDLSTSSSVEDAVSGVTTVTLGFRTTGTTNAPLMTLLSTDGTFPIDNLPVVGSVAILEEYIYYLRDDAGGPVLSRAQVFPGTTTAYRNQPQNLNVDIAENVVDLQIALGFDLDDDGEVLETVNGEGDEWLLNAPFTADNPAAAPWSAALVDPTMRLRYLRIETLTQSEQREKHHLSPLIISIGDQEYGPTHPLNDPGIDPSSYEGNRKFHREVLRTDIDLRNM